ncbi:hypothetical protein [Streptomyces lydicus]|uniref:hypothetical protein n=1 Tax=Streptomyces lydicus TaxID=47763 RepID=UPI00380DD9D9
MKESTMTAPGRFPLRPGKPLVFRRPNGNWGYDCICHSHVSAAHKAKPVSSERHNCESWEQALREAQIHVRFTHKTLERLYALPASAERSAA